MKLFELLKSVYEYKLTFGNRNQRCKAEFRTDQGHTVRINFMYMVNRTPKFWEIDFGRFENPETDFSFDDNFGINSKGDAFKIFSTVLYAINDFIEKAKEPEWIMFSADESSRKKLYNTFEKRFKHSNYVRVKSGPIFDKISDGYDSEVFLYHNDKAST